jgi:tetratricopeptide (TPR) repeat protein
MKKQTLILSLILLTGIMGCRERIEPEADDFVEYGWTLYVERDFQGAYAEFQEGLGMDSLYIDGYNGSGWCYVEFNHADTATAFFNSGLEYITEDSSQIYYELLAGRAFSAQVLGDYQTAIDDGALVYAGRPVFEFTHDWRINYVDIVALVAASHYALGEFSAALGWVQKLDSSFSVDINTNKGRADLIKKIETFQQL